MDKANMEYSLMFLLEAVKKSSRNLTKEDIINDHGKNWFYYAFDDGGWCE